MLHELDKKNLSKCGLAIKEITVQFHNAASHTKSEIEDM